MNKFEALNLEDSQNSDSGDEVEEQIDEQEHKPKEKVKPPPLEIEEGEHQLQFPYALWFSKRPPGKQQFNYEDNIKLVGRFATVEQFWSVYSWLVHPCELTGHCDYHLFKDGIKPMWEDEANQLGGKWIVRLKKGLASRFWENLDSINSIWTFIDLSVILHVWQETGREHKTSVWPVVPLRYRDTKVNYGKHILAILGEQFMVGDEICGAVISIRFQEDIISVWNRTYSDQAVTTRIRDTLKRVLSLPMNTIMEYKTHNNSIKDNSSFRNTAIFSS